MKDLLCKAGHPMTVKGARHCGQCGAGPATEMVKCSDPTCGSTFAKADAPKCCLDCGKDVRADSPIADFETAIADLDTFTKGRIDAEKKLSVLPTVNEDDIDLTGLNDIIAKARLDEGGIDATPVVAELLKSVGVLALENRALAEHQTRWGKHNADGNARIAGAILGLAQMVKAQGLLIERLASRSNGPRQLGLLDIHAQPHTAAADHNQGGDQGNTPDFIKAMIGGGDVEDVPPHELMVKANVAIRVNGAELKGEDMMVLETYANQGASLHNICKADPVFGARIVRAFHKVPAAA